MENISSAVEFSVKSSRQPPDFEDFIRNSRSQLLKAALPLFSVATQLQSTQRMEDPVVLREIYATRSCHSEPEPVRAG